MKKYITIFILAITSLIWVPLLLLIQLITGKANVKPEEVLKTLEEMKSGKIDQHWWDDFLSVKIKDKNLDNIRLECEAIYTENSPHLLKSDEGEFSLSESGIKAIGKLIEKCKATMQNT